MVGTEVLKTVNFVTQKGFSGACGFLGIKMLLEANVGSEGDKYAFFVGAFLLSVAAIIEFLMWRHSGRMLKERMSELKFEKKQIEERMKIYDDALIQWLKAGTQRASTFSTSDQGQH